MNCAECKEILVAYIEGLLQDAQKQTVEKHLKDCQVCRAELAELASLRDRLVANGNALAQSDLEDKVLNRIIRQQNLKLKKVNKLETHFLLWRNIMKSRISKFAAAAVIIIAVALSIIYLDTATPAYALEQTIQASHSVRYIHTKSFWTGHEEPTEAWIEFDVTGEVRNVRMHLPAWTEPHDGDKEVVWKYNKAHLWIKKKNIFVVMKDNVIAEMIFKTIEGLDPKTALQSLQQLKSENKIELDIDRPKDKTSPIIVTATLLEEIREDQPITHTEREITKLITLYKGSSNPFSKFVLLVDQATKLVTSIEFYEQREGQEHCACILEYYDYNQPIAAELFVLEDEIPANAMRIDQTAQEVGLAQDELTDKEIAVEVIRQFLQALIDQDYSKAGRLFSGVPAERIEKTYGKIRFIRIISIEEPIPHALTGGLYVPCTVEIEENGKIIQWHPEHSYVRQVHGQPDRWEIIGGFRGI